MKVKDVMTPTVQTCLPETSLATAARMMWESDCGAIPVVNVSDRVVGMITDRDICMSTASQHRDPAKISVAEVISGNAYMCKADDDVRDALKTMKKERVHRLPVIDAEGNLLGMLSISDLVLRAKENGVNKSDLSYADVIKTLKGLCAHRAIATQQKHVNAVGA